MSNVQNVLTQIQSNTAQVQAEQAKKNMGSTEMGQDAFLKLLMAQLKYQDPLNPTSNTEFISQQAQFTQISEMQKMNSAINSLNQSVLGVGEIVYTSGLIGKEATFIDPDDPKKTITGIITEAKYGENGSTLIVDGREVLVGDILSIREAPKASTETGTTTEEG